MIHLLRLLTLLVPFSSTFIRLIPMGRMVTIRGYSSRRIPASLVPLIIDRINPRGIHQDSQSLRLDGGRLDDLATKGIEGLTLRQMVGLEDAGDIGLESAALTFNGDVVIETTDRDLIDRAQRRGATVGFEHANATLALASRAAQISGRKLSGAF